MPSPVDVEKLLSQLYLPETTFAKKAVKVNDQTAALDHVLTGVQCAPRKTDMLRGVIEASGVNLTNTQKVKGELFTGHFIDFGLFAGHQGFGMLLAAGSHNNPMWWREVASISFQSPVIPEDEVVATATITKEDESSRTLNGRVLRGTSIHTRASGIKLEFGNAEEFKDPYLPQNAWLEVAAHFGGGALSALGEFPEGDMYPVYLGTGKVTLPKELARPNDRLRGIVTLNSVDNLDLDGLGQLKVVSVDEVITREVLGSNGEYRFSEVEFGFMPRQQLLQAIKGR